MKKKNDIAIIGLSCKLPEAEDQFQFWEQLSSNNSCIKEIPEDRWKWKKYWGDPKQDKNKTNSRWGGFIKDADAFDHDFFGLTPKAVETMDPQQRLTLELTWKCLEDAGISPSSVRGEKVGFIYSAFNYDYKELQDQKNNYSIEAHYSTGAASPIIANRVSHYFDFKGPSLLIDTACSGSLNSIHCAVQALQLGDCDLAFAGGVSLMFTPTRHISFSKMGMMSPTGTCRSFDESANGYVRGEGAGILLLKPLDKAIKDNDSIYGVIKGTAVNHCGETYTLTYPSPNAQANVIIEAHEKAGVPIDSISYIEAHGTGTPKGDPIEFQGLEQSFTELAKRQGISLDNNYCGIGSVKTTIGHLEPAAGVAGVIKVLLQMRNRQLPGINHFKKLNPRISIDETPFYIVDENRTWKPSVNNIDKNTKQKYPLRAGVSSFGFGGTNSHIVLEEAPENKKITNKGNKRHLPLYPIAISAKSKTALKQKIHDLKEWLAKDQDIDLIDLSYTLTCRREHLSNRMACMVDDLNQLIKVLSEIDCEKKSVQDFTKGKKNTPFKKQVSTLLDAYVNDESFDFKKLFSSKATQILRLPTYPFAKNRFWLKNKGQSSQMSGMHPLVHTNVSDFEFQSYHTSFSGDEFVVKDHRVEGKSVLPGAAYIEMVVKSVLDSARFDIDVKSIQLDKVAWLRPVVVDHHGSELFINLFPTENVESNFVDEGFSDFKIEFEISSFSEDARVIHCQGVVQLQDKSTDDDNKKQLELLSQIAQESVESDNSISCKQERFYQLMTASGLDYGMAFQGVKSFYVMDNAGAARISLPEAIKDNDRDKFIIHPSLLDAAIQSTVALIWARQCNNQSELKTLFDPSAVIDDIKAQLPFLLNNALIQNVTGNELFVAVRLTNESNGVIHTFDIDIANVSNEGSLQNIALNLTGLTLKALSQQPSSEVSSQSDNIDHNAQQEDAKDFDYGLSFNNDEGYYTPLWIEQDVNANAVTTKTNGNLHNSTVLIVYPQHGYDQAKPHINYLISQGSKVIELIISDQFSAINEKNVVHIRAANEEDASSFITALKEKKVTLDYVLHIPASNTYATNAEQLDKFRQAIDDGVKTLFALTKSLVRFAKKLRLITVVRGEVFSQPQYLGLSGFFKTLHLEKPSFNGRVIQIDQDKDDLNSILEQEFLDLEKHNDIAYINKKRYVRMFEDCKAMSKAEIAHQHRIDLNKISLSEDVQFVKNGVYVITGGLGALGLIFARHLMQNYHAKVYLTGRSPLNDNKITTIDSLNQLAGEAEYIQCDVNDFNSVKQSLNAVREKTGKIDGILHSAGIIEDDFIIKKAFNSFTKVITPKSQGTVNLDLATVDDQLSCFILFSSVTGALGNIGQCDYGYGNAFEDYFSLHRNILAQKGLRKGRSVSINWPYWRNGGMTLTEKEEEILNKNFGIIPLETGAGIEAIEKALQLPFSQFAVLPGNAEKVRDVLGCVKALKKSMPLQQQSQVTKNALSIEALKHNAVEYLIDLFAEELKVPKDRFTLDGAFQEFGFDSVVMLDMIDVMEKRFSDLPKTLFFENQNIADLSQFLAENYPEALGNKPNQDSEEINDDSVNGISVESSELKNTHVNHGQRLSRTRLYDKNTGIRQTDNRVAIVGLAGRYPEADSVDEFWDNLAAGMDCIREVPSDRWDVEQFFQPGEATQGKSYSKWGGFLKDVDKFDALFFNISPKEAEKLDPQERLFLEVVYHAIEDAGYHPDNLAGAMPNQERPVGVYAGVMWGDYQLHGIESENPDNWVTPHSFYWSIANRVSYFFNFSGPSLNIDTACSSSLTAIHLACNAIANGEVKAAIAGGVSLSLHANKYNLLSDMKFLSSDGRCRSFGENGDGYVPGECVSAVVLKSLADAERDGDHIYGVIRGTSVNHGGKTSGFTVPNPNRQASLIKEALDKAQVNPRHISYVEAHGTGTSLGDPIEISGLTKAYAQSENQYCTIGSAKSNIGHAEASAGIAGLSKVLLQMKHKQLAPSLHSKTLNPYIDFATTPFKVNQTLTAWQRPLAIDDNGNKKELPRIAGISSFGAGGANGHIIVEEYSRVTKAQHSQGHAFIIPISAKKKDALYKNVNNLRDFLIKNRDQHLNSLAYTLQTGRVEHNWRLAIVTQNSSELVDQLTEFMNGNNDINGVFFKDSAVRANAESSAIQPESVTAQHTLDHLQKLASSWVNGSSIMWDKLYDQDTPKKIPLPGYAYQRQRYWIEKNNDSRTSIKGLHPVLHKNISTLNKIAYTTDFQSSDFYLKDHQINGNRILPGVVYLEMAYQAIGKALPEARIESIYDVQWLKPIVVNNTDKNSGFTIEISKDAYGYIFEVYQEQNAVKHTFCKGAFGIIPESTMEDDSRLKTIENRMGLIDIRNRHFNVEKLKSTAKHITNAQLAEAFESMGFSFGETFQPFKEICFTDQYALAKLQLPDTAVTPSTEFILNPVLMDAALRTTTAIDFDKLIPGETPLPVDLSRLQIVQPLQNTIYVYVEKAETHQKVIGRGNFDIYLLDESGQVSLYLESFETQKVKGFLKGYGTAAKSATVKKANHIKKPSQIAVTNTQHHSEASIETVVLDHLKMLLSEQTKIDIQDINESESIESYGVESVMIHAINEKLIQTFGEDISKTLFYEYATIGEVAEYLAENFSSMATTLIKADVNTVEFNDNETNDRHQSSTINNHISPQATVENYLLDQLAEVTKISISDISVTEPFESYGIDSLMINTMNERFSHVFGQDISKTLFYEYADIESLAEYFVENHEQEIINIKTVEVNEPQKQAIEEHNAAIDSNDDESHLSSMEIYLKNLIFVGSNDEPSQEYRSNEVFLDDIQQLKLSHHLRVELGIALSVSVLLSFNIAELASYLIKTQDIDFEKIEKINKEFEGTIDALESSRKTDLNENIVPNNKKQKVHPNRKQLAQLLAVNGDHLNKQDHNYANQDIAIVGLSGRYPLADNLDEFWQNLIDARDCIREVPADRWQHSKYFDPDRSAKGKVYSKWGGFIDNADQFDADFFKMTRREAEVLDPQERLFLETAWQCLEDASYSKISLKNASVGVFVGAMWGHYELIEVSQEQEKFGRPSASFSSIANRVSYFFDFNGPSLAMDSMCSSSLSAIHTACQSIRSGDCEYAIAGGVNIATHVKKYQLLCQQQFLSDDGRCRAFGEGGSGYVPGEGAGSVLLKPLQKAIEDGDHVYAVVKGSALNHGGKTSGFTVPNQREQSHVISKAIERAGWSADSIQYIEAHGTGTSLGDPIEVSGLTKAFSASEKNNRKHPCYLGSVKSNIGHLESAAGIAGLTKILLQMQHGMIAPSLHSDRLNPNLTIDESRFSVPQKACEWKRTKDASGYEMPRRAGLSSFGAGGSNAHLLIEEFIQENTTQQGPAIQQTQTQEPCLFVLSAGTKERLKLYVEQVNRFINEKVHHNETAETDFLRKLSYSSLLGRSHETVRLAVVSASLSDLQAALKAYLDNGNARNLYVGMYDHKNADLYSLVDKQTQAVLLSSLLKPGRMDPLAKAWVSSMNIEWTQHINQLFDDNIPGRISFPSQPLLTERFWVDEISEKASSSMMSSIHPLLDANISSIQQQAFTKLFTGKEFYLADHLVENNGAQKILPGVAYLEMAYTAANLSIPSDFRVCKIRDVMWLAPIQVNDKAQHVKMTLSQKAHGMEYKVSDSDNESVLYSSGDIDFSYSKASKDNQMIDIDSIKAQGGLREDSTEIYQQFHAMGFYYGPAYQVTEWRLRQNNGTLSKLKLPEGLGLDSHQYSLHPSLMDGAIRTCLMVGNNSYSSPMIPFSLGEVEIFAPITNECYAYAQLSEDNQQQINGAKSSTARYDLIITDLHGNVLVKISKITARKLSNSENTDNLNYFHYDWKTATIGSDQTVQVSGLLGFANDEIQTSACQSICALDQQIWVIPGRKFSELSNNRYVIRVDHQEDYQRLFEELDKNKFKLSHVVNLLNTQNVIPDAHHSNIERDIQDQLDCSVLLIYFLFRQINHHYANDAILFIDVDHMHGEQRSPFKAATAGFANSTVPINHKVQMCSVSINKNNNENLSDTLQTIINGKRVNGREFRLVSNQKGIQERVLHQSAYSDDQMLHQPFNDGHTYIITGGLGRLGLVIAEYLVSHFNCDVVLVSRSKPADYQQKAIDKLNKQLQQRSADHTVVHMMADMADYSSVTELFKQVNSAFDHIKGVIHAAGQATETSVLDLDINEFSKGLTAKIHGLIYLTAQARQYDLDFIINFSSVSSQLGDLGSANYAASNRFMDEYAACFNDEKCAMQSINWPLWKSGGLIIPDQEIAAMRFSGMAPMPEEKGIQAFEYALAQKIHQVFVVYGEKDRILQKFSVEQKRGVDTAIKAPNMKKRPIVMKKTDELKQVQLNQADSKNNKMNHLARVKQLVKASITDITKLASDRINDDDPFESFGMDSVQLMELQSHIADQVSGLPKTILFEQDSVEKLSEYLYEHKFEELSEPLNLTAVVESEELVKPLADSQHESKTPTDSPLGINDSKNTQLYSTGKTEDDTDLPDGVVSIAHLFHKMDAQNIPPMVKNTRENSQNDDEIAVIGMAGRFPETETLAGFWDKLATGQNCIRPLPEERWSKYQVGKKRHLKLVEKAYGGFLNNVDGFDHDFFGLSRLEAGRMDPQLRVLMETVWHAIEDSAYTKKMLSKNEVGVFVGAMNNDHSNVSEDLLLQDNTYVGPGSIDSELSNRISYLLDVYGPSVTIKTACSSSMTALHMACKAIATGDCKMAIVAGVNLSLHPQKYLMMQDMKVLSATGVEKTFDIDADGLIPSEGVGVIILKQKTEAVKAADNIHGIIKATSISHSGVGAGQFIPNIKVLEKTMQKCLDKSGLDASAVNYIETHGTATALGDPIEIRAIENFAQNNDIDRLQIGTKANLGHMEAASGICSLIKVLLSMKNKAIAPCANLTQVCDAIDQDNSPLVLNKKLTSWEKNAAGTRVAGINSFGMGGSNGFTLIESYAEKTENTTSAAELPIVLFSAKTTEQLKLLIQEHINYFSEENIDEGLKNSLHSICYTTQCGRTEFSQRVAFVPSSLKHLLELMKAFVKTPQEANADIVSNHGSQNDSDVIDLMNRLDNKDLYQKLCASGQWIELASLWVKGIMIDWQSMYQKPFPAKVSLPGYPFKHVDCAIHNVLDEIKSIEQKKNLSLSVLSQNKNELKISQNAQWYVANKPKVLKQFETHLNTSGDKKREQYFIDYWTSQLAEQETLLCQSLEQQTTNPSKNDSVSAQVEGLSLSILKSFSAQHRIEIETIAAMAWAVVLNRNTKVKAPSFGLNLNMTGNKTDEVTDAIFPYQCHTIVKSKCLAWLTELQSQMESRYGFSHLENMASDVTELLDVPVNAGMDSLVVINGGVSEAISAHFSVLVSLIYDKDKLEVIIDCANDHVLKSELNRILDEFILVLTSIHKYTDKLPGAITLKPPKNKIHTTFKRIERM